jgi:hypothetical protein
LERPYSAQACCRNDLAVARGSFALRAQDFACGLERPQSGSTWRGLTVPRLAAATVTQRAASRTQILRMEKVGRTLLRASSFRWYRFQTVVEIKATHPVRRCRCEACRHLECRSFKNQNDGPLRFGRLFPGWSLSNVGCSSFSLACHPEPREAG